MVSNIAALQTILTYIMALVVVIGGGLMLYGMRLDGIATADLRMVVAGFMGTAIGYVFYREVGAATAREAAHQTAVTAANGSALGH